MIIHTKEKPSPLCAECGKYAEGEKLVSDVRKIVWVHADCLQSFIERRTNEDHLEAKFNLDVSVIFE